MNAVLLTCALACSPSADPEPPKPPTQEQIKAWLKKIEEPTGDARDPKQGPPEDGLGPTFEYRWHGAEIEGLRRAGDAVMPALIALLEDTSKSGQARAHAAALLIDLLKGKGEKQDLNPKILKVLKEALKDKDPALKWGILDWLQGYGAAHWREYFARIPKEKWMVDPGTMHLSDAAMDGLLPEIITLVAHEEPVIAAKAAYVIFAFGRPKHGVKELLAALDRREVRIRASAVAALSRIGVDDPAVLKAVLMQLKPEHYVGSYSLVIEAIGRFGPKAKDALPALIAVLKDDNAKKTQGSDSAYLYAAAFDALGAIGPDAKDAAPAILTRMQDQVVIREALDKVVAALDKINPEAAKQARAIMKRQTGELYTPKKP